MTNMISKKIIIFFNVFNFLLSTDYIIITTNDLKDSATNIIDIYSDPSKTYFLNMELALFDTMSMPINDYLDYKISENSSLKYLLIIGDENDIPTPTKAVNCGNGQDEYPSDDFFSSIDQSSPPRLATGRIPTSVPSKAIEYSLKLKDYMESTSNGAWRSKVLLISDDEIKNNSSLQSEIQHTIYSDSIYQKISDISFTKTLYGPMYEAEYSGSERRLPTLTDDIINYLNSGAAIINYIGHGDPETWAAEHIIDKNRDINIIDIPDSKLPIWIAGTCYFGRYDNVDSMSESLLLETNGAIAILGATRSISKAINKKFLDNFYGDIRQHILDGQGLIRLGDLFLDSKNYLYDSHTSNFHYTSNCDGGYLYDILGDPAIPMPLAKLDNSIIEYSENINLLESYPLEPASTNNDYQFLQILDEEPKIELNYTDGDNELNYSFYYSPKIIYQNNFEGNTCYIPPIDLVSNEYIQIKFYQEQLDNNISFSGPIYIQASNDFINDESGPRIDFYSNENKITSNSIVSKNDTISIVISDSLGINTSENIGHATRYWFNNESNYINVNPEDCSYIESCNNLLCKIGAPTDFNGQNTLYIESWDNANNKTIDSLKINIMEKSNKVYNLFNFPNPFSERTFFTFQIQNNENYSVKTKIRIYAQDGTLLMELADESNQNFISIEWNGNDSNSNLLPNGTYIYTAEIKIDEESINTAGKLSIIR